jgi:hypothetical protein
VWDHENSKLQLLGSKLDDLQRLPSKFRRIAVIEYLDIQASYHTSIGTSPTSDSYWFSLMEEQYVSLREQTRMENEEMQKAQAFWNPLASMSKKDATS